jgi:hypothetical protein
VADTVFNLAENSREEVAYKLMKDIFSVEGVNLNVEKSTTRDKILSTYADCYRVVDGKNPPA